MDDACHLKEETVDVLSNNPNIITLHRFTQNRPLSGTDPTQDWDIACATFGGSRVTAVINHQKTALRNIRLGEENPWLVVKTFVLLNEKWAPTGAFGFSLEWDEEKDELARNCIKEEGETIKVVTKGDEQSECHAIFIHRVDTRRLFVFPEGGFPHIGEREETLIVVGNEFVVLRLLNSAFERVAKLRSAFVNPTSAFMSGLLHNNSGVRHPR